MYVILLHGTTIENCTIVAAGPGKGGMGFAIHQDGHTRWFDQDEIIMIRFDRDTVNDPAPEPGPDDFRIGTRHEAAQAAMRQVMGELDGTTIE